MNTNAADELAKKNEDRQQQLAIFNQKKQRVSGLLEQYKGQIAQALPKILTVERMIQTCLTAMLRTPSLMDCTGHSLVSCILTSAQLGLMPDNILGECYLIPFKNNRKNGIMECTFIPGYKGLLTLAMRSGQVKSISAMAVFGANEQDGDVFDYDQGLNEKLVHKPSGLSDAKRITHFYAIVRLSNGGHIFKVMTRTQVEAVRNESANYKHSQYKESTIWGKYFDEMGCKTVLRRVLKYVPLSPEVARIIALDESAEAGKQNISIDFLNELPNEAEDITHEVIEEEKYNDGEHQDGQNNERTEKAANALSATADAIGAGPKKVVPKKQEDAPKS